MLDFLVVIQARLYSSRLPGKCMMDVGGRPMVKRVWDAAREAMKPYKAKVIVAWPERFPELDENDVRGRFRELALEFPSEQIMRLTSDCPLLESADIAKAIHSGGLHCYYSNHLDGRDVQLFHPHILFSDTGTDKEHVIADFTTKKSRGPVRSVDTLEDLQIVRATYAR